MKFEADRADLSAALSKCLLATDLKSPHTPFKSCLVETDGKDQVRFVASTEIVSVDTVIAATVIEPGKFVLSPHKLSDMISAMPKGAIILNESGADKLTVKTSSMKRGYTLHRVDCEMRPMGDTPGGGLGLNSKELLAAWDIIEPSVPTDEADFRTPPAAALTVSKDSFALCGGCGRSVGRTITVSKNKQAGSAILPVRAFAILRKMVADDERVTIYSDDRRIYLENSDTLAAVSLHAGQLPPLDTVLESYRNEAARAPGATLPADLFVGALRAVSLPVDKSADVLLILDADGSLTLSTESHEGSAEEELSAQEARGSFSAKIAAAVAIPVLAPLGEEPIAISNLAEQRALFITTQNTSIIVMVIGQKES
jgi:DNA polymerase III sliding clamp (beta) subunit (PCNA family)